MGRQVLVPAEHVRLSIPLPDDARQRAITPLDLSAAGGAKLALQRAWALPDGGSLEVACVRAAAHLWVSGLEGGVLAGASPMVRDRASLSVLEPQAIKLVAGHWQQSFEASATEPSPLQASGRHVLGFVGADRDVLLCSLVCSGPPPAELCLALSAGLEVQGELLPPPEPGMVAATLSFAAAHPRTALTIGGIGALMVAALIVIRRPRPSW